MSIAIMIDKPKNETEKSFYIPVATEKTFQTYWMKASEDLNLKWVPIFKTGIFIESEDKQVVSKEILLVKEWVIKNVSDLDKKMSLEERIDYILDSLSKIFEDKSIKLYIG